MFLHRLYYCFCLTLSLCIEEKEEIMANLLDRFITFIRYKHFKSVKRKIRHFVSTIISLYITLKEQT